MDFFGKIGIDWHLLIAQIINFAVLLWLLSKFLYRPIIERIEADEASLAEADKKSAQLEREKNDFELTQQEQLAQVKEKSEVMISEARQVVEQIRSKAISESERDADSYLRQKRSAVDASQKMAEAAWREEVAAKISTAVLNRLEELISGETRAQLDEYFFRALLNRIPTLELPSLALPKEKKSNNHKSNLNHDTSSLGPIIVESVDLISATRAKDLTTVIEQCLRAKIKLVKRVNKKLIAGFRLELAGFIIDSNILNEISDAIKK